MNEELRKGYRKAVIISGALAASALIYAFVVESLKLYGDLSYPLATQEDLLRILKYVFLGLSVVDFFIIRFIRGASVVGMRKRGLTGSKLINSMVAMSVVEGGICLSVALFGVVLFILGGDSSQFYKHLVLSLVLFGFFFPRFGDWEERWRAAEMAHEPSL